jgi:hypothetical protein
MLVLASMLVAGAWLQDYHEPHRLRAIVPALLLGLLAWYLWRRTADPEYRERVDRRLENERWDEY